MFDNSMFSCNLAHAILLELLQYLSDVSQPGMQMILGLLKKHERS